MKKAAMFLSVCLLAALFAGCGKKEEGPKIRVTVVTAGKVQLAAKEVAVKDADGDGAYTINEAIQSAHDTYGSADKPFKVEDTDFGKSITCVWGDENGLSGYGVYMNNEMAYDVAAPVSEGDYLCVYSYADLTNWSDTYSYFDVLAGEASGGKISLTLTYVGLDADWNPVKSPLAGAVITVDGEATDFVTDADGKVTVELSGKGEKLLSATTDALVLIPPVAYITVK